MSITTMHDGRVVLHQADCLTAMAEMEENSVDAVICDPPYHLTSIVKRFGGDMPPRTEATVGKHAFGRHATGFMGRTWDGGDIAFQPETWAAVLRVLKPGGYIVAFASTRGFGRMSVAMEDAGFITHPMLAWIFGSGFPKATRIAAEGYDGFRYGGQALKPALEPIYMGQKPFSEKTGTANILKWGTGAVNIDGCRISWPDGKVPQIGTPEWGGPNKKSTAVPGQDGETVEREGPSSLGRWPANVLTDGSDEVIGAFPDAPGQQRSVGPEHGEKASQGIYGDYGAREHFAPRVETDKNAARFFYAAKASRADRDAGLEGKNSHPTVKPTNLMSWLCRLVTPPGGTILDPFLGSGSTGKAAVLEGFQFIGCEREDEYMPIAAARIAWAIGHVDSPPKAVVAQQLAAANDNGLSDQQPVNDLFSAIGAAA